MKKMLLLLAAMLFVCTVFTVPPAYAVGEREVRVIVNKKIVDFSGDVKPFINEDNRTMVPVRFVSNELGASVEWDGDTQKVTIKLAGKNIELIIGDNFALVNGERREFDTAAVIVEWEGIGRTMVPVRFISQTFGAGVDWNDLTRTVYVTMGPAEPPPPPAVTNVTLYFSDDQGQYLMPEMRKVELTKPLLAELIFRELLAGPNEAHLRPTIPDGTRHMGLNVYGGVAYVNLSSHFRDNHWGGASGDTLTLYSIVNSLAQISDVNEVQFLLEGTYQEAMLGHTNTMQPLAPRYDLVQE